MSRKEDLFKITLTSAYNHNAFVDFSREIIADLNVGPYLTEIKPYNTFSAFISKYFKIGDFEDPNGNRVGLFSVELLRGESVERARTAQRTFVKSLLENGGYAAALVAFYSPDNDKWRFSFVRMDYEFAKGKIKESLTPARRYSYLVGRGEPCHTAMDRLLPIFMDDNSNPTIDVIEEAFSVEKVTKDFFEAYKEKYLQLAEYLEENEDFVTESQHKGFTTEQFTKKLLSQIVFLYFIQKKGWLGVNAVPRVLTEKEYKNAFFSHGKKSRELVGMVYQQEGDYYRLNAQALRSLSDEDEIEFSKCVKGQSWGTGPKDFMRRIYDNAVKRGQNFFDDCLEPLFYTGLNQDRGENAFFPPLHCRIPFLNGGLFEELDHYDWQHNDFDIPNDIFSNADTKGRDADGILDIFDRYNFTMAEDEPLEKEVAVDPEMLGKVFENLLEVRDRKSKGAFYTPREIVHYMCSESLINYLVTKSGIPEEDIRKFITYGEFFKDEDARRTKKDPASGKYVYDYNKPLEMPASILDYSNNVNRINELDELLSKVKVVDPAVGSGAFPLGLLNEIVKARDTLTMYMAIPMNGFQRRMLYAQRSPYQLKTQTIKNCIFACDIEPSATDITKLRLWLALVIEDEIGDKENDEFGEHTKPRKLPNLDCNVLCGNSLIDSFEGIQLICNTEALGNAVSGTMPTVTEQLIKGHIDNLIEMQERLYNASTSAEKEELKKQIQVVYDAIIMEQLQVNPNTMYKYSDPAIRHAASKPFILWPLYFPKVFKENGGFDICIGNPPYVSVKGISASDKALFRKLFLSAQGRFNLFCLMIEKGIGLINSAGILCFIQPEGIFTNIEYRHIRKLIVEEASVREVVMFDDRVFESAAVDTAILRIQKIHSENNVIIVKRNLQTIVNHIDQKSITKDTDYMIPVSSDAKGQQLVEKIKSKEDYSVGQLLEIQQGIIYSGTPKEEIFSNNIVNEHYKKCLDGRDVHKWFIRWEDKAENKYIEYTKKLHRPREERLFLAPEKILLPRKSTKIACGYDDKQYYALNTAYICLPINDDIPLKYILGILNSSLMNYYYKSVFLGWQITIPAFKSLPIAVDKVDKVVDLVNCILMEEPNLEALEEKLDDIVFDIYDITEEEQQMIKETI